MVTHTAWNCHLLTALRHSRLHSVVRAGMHPLSAAIWTKTDSAPRPAEREPPKALALDLDLPGSSPSLDWKTRAVGLFGSSSHEAHSSFPTRIILEHHRHLSQVALKEVEIFQLVCF